MPMFEIEGDYDLKSPLEAMGFERLFQPGSANFFGINKQKNLFVKEAVQKTFFKASTSYHLFPIIPTL